MEIDEIIATCSLPPVASAAVRSIGGDFSKRMNLLAAAAGMSDGEFVASMVRNFGETFDDCDRRGLKRAMKRSLMPVLTGLQLIVEAALDDEDEAVWRREERDAGRDCTHC